MVTSFFIKLSLLASVTFFALGKDDQYTKCGGDVPLNVKTIKFPQRGKYAGNLYCSWKIGRKVIIKFKYIDIEYNSRCAYDYLQIGTKKYCGTTKPNNLNIEANVVFRFHSDGSVHKTGFEVEFVKPVVLPPGTLFSSCTDKFSQGRCHGYLTRGLCDKDLMKGVYYDKVSGGCCKTCDVHPCDRPSRGGCDYTCNKFGPGFKCSGPKDYRYHLNQTEIDSCISSTNSYRHNHQRTPDLQWDEGLAKDALDYAQVLMMETIKRKSIYLEHSNDTVRKGAGENLFSGKAFSVGTKRCSAANEAWYVEIMDYNFANGSPNQGKTTANFTQLVWKGTTKFGIGVAIMDKDIDPVIIVVGRYSPKGNSGSNDENVENLLGNMAISFSSPEDDPTCNDKPDTYCEGYKDQGDCDPSSNYFPVISRKCCSYCKIHPCDRPSNGGCIGTCNKVIEGYFCSCEMGYVMGADNRTCIRLPLGAISYLSIADDPSCTDDPNTSCRWYTNKDGCNISSPYFWTTRKKCCRTCKFHPCDRWSKGGCNHLCKKESAGYTCFCHEWWNGRWSLEADKRTCSFATPGNYVVPWNQTAIDKCVANTNDYRKRHINTNGLEWDALLAKDAQKWANHLMNETKRRRKFYMEHYRLPDILRQTWPNEGPAEQGENLYGLPAGAYSWNSDCSAANSAWYGEVLDYDFFTHKPIYPGLVTGHFTQLVWKSTRKFGLGIAKEDKVEHPLMVIVARYDPAGNSPYNIASEVGLRPRDMDQVYTKCGGDVPRSIRLITYPPTGNYGSNVDCTWNIGKKAKLYFESFDIERSSRCKADYVLMNNRKWCGKVHGQMKMDKFTFHSNAASGGGKGIAFRLEMPWNDPPWQGGRRKCGNRTGHTLPNGKTGECDPVSKWPCCDPNGDCNQPVSNIERCSCPTCKDYRFHCKTPNGCSDICLLYMGRPTCRCNKGRSLGHDGKTCEDKG